MHHFPQPDRGSVSILDVARSQYISLHQRKNESKKSLRQGNERGKTESDKRPVPTPTPPHAPRTLKKTTGNRSSQPPLQKEARGTTKPCTAEKTVHPRSNNSKKTTRETGKGPPDGGSSWKEKAITAREKARQRPMSILQQLHRHQVCMKKERVCPFNNNDICRVSHWQCRRRRVSVSTSLVEVH